MLECLSRAGNHRSEQRLENPVWHIHAGKVPAERYPVSFALLLNLVSASNAHNRDVLWGFIRAYAPDAVAGKPIRASIGWWVMRCAITRIS